MTEQISHNIICSRMICSRISIFKIGIQQPENIRKGEDQYDLYQPGQTDAA